MYQSEDREGNKVETEVPWRQSEGGGSVEQRRVNLQRDFVPTFLL